MIIHKIEIECIAFVKAKNHAPIAADCNAPIVREIAFQPMQTPAWKQSDVFDGVRRVNGREHVAHLSAKLAGMARRSSLSKSRLKPLWRKL
jgi:hypothetical protein